MHAQAGLAIVEFALVTPLLMMILVGLIEFGRFMFFSVLLGNAASAGVQFGAQNITNAALTSSMASAALADGQNIAGLKAVASQVYKCWDGTTATVLASATAPCATLPVVDYVQVVTTGTFSTLFSYPGLPSTFTASRTAQMRVSQ